MIISIPYLFSFDHLNMQNCVRVESQLLHVFFLVLRVRSPWEIAHESKFTMHNLLHPIVHLRYFVAFLQLKDANFTVFCPDFECANLFAL